MHHVRIMEYCTWNGIIAMCGMLKRLRGVQKEAHEKNIESICFSVKKYL